MERTRNIAATGAITMALAVGLGAFGAHALKQQLSPDVMAVYQTAVQYHFYHALGLLALAALYDRYKNRFIKLAAWFIIIGIFLFSGSLYVLAISGIKKLGIITPFGGVAFIAGWLLACWGFWTNDKKIPPAKF